MDNKSALKEGLDNDFFIKEEKMEYHFYDIFVSPDNETKKLKLKIGISDKREE